MLVTGLILGLGLYLGYVAWRCFFRVSEGHLAVLTSFGAAEFTERSTLRLRTHGPGLHLKKPWQVVHAVPMMEQNLDLSGEEGGRVAMADDGTILRFDSILRYHPVREELYQFLFGLRAPLEHITGLFTCLLRNEIANFRPLPAASTGSGALATDASLTRAGFDAESGSYALIRRERKLLNEHIEGFCRSQIGNRYGVQFNAVDLIDILPPDELAAALNAVIQARTEADARYFRAEGECQQRLLSAERGVEIATARALAVETEILSLGRHLTTVRAQGTLAAYVARRRAEVQSESRAVFVKERA